MIDCITSFGKIQKYRTSYYSFVYILCKKIL